MACRSLVYILSFCLASLPTSSSLNTDLDEANEFLTNYDATAKVVFYAAAVASWNWNTNITDYNQEKDLEASMASAAFRQEAYQNASLFNDTDFPDDIKRQFRFIKDIGSAALPPEELEKYNLVLGEMENNYATNEVCKPDDPNDCVLLDPDLSKIMATSTDWDELTWAWKGFRDAVGIPNKPLYKTYVGLANDIAVANGHADMGEYWRSAYEMDDFKGAVYGLYNDILPLYKELHAYVRRIMYNQHSDQVNINGLIPSNLLGDMWGRFWGNIYSQVIPYPDSPNIDVTEALIEQDYTALRMFQLGDDFFASLGLLNVKEAFWNNSMIERPTEGQKVVCHPTAWDMGDGEDFRIKMCTEINMEYFQTIHHELGHTQYQMQYSPLPVAFHDGANSAFHEAVGEVMTLSVSTPTHLANPDIGLLDIGDGIDDSTDINFLLKTALDTIGTLPFSLALDQWRWDVFAGDVSDDKWTERWWELKHDLVGVRSPVTRTEDDFDPGAMYHIVISYPFTGYFIRTIIQFQFQKALCDASGYTGPLHRCDFYKSTAAGKKLENMLKMGSSKPWPDAMEEITGQRAMSADAINAYFGPLMTWLQKTNKENNEHIGWDGGRGAGIGMSSSLLFGSSMVVILLNRLRFEP